MDVLSSIEEEQDCEQGSQASGKELHVWGLRKTKKVQEVPLRKKTELVSPAGGSCLSIVVDRLDVWRNLSVIVLQIALLIFSVKESNGFLILFLDAILIDEHGSCCTLSLKFDTFDRHHSHEVVSWVAEIGALESNGAEIVHCKVRFVEVDDLSSGKEHQLVKHLENVWIRLMNCTDNCSSIFSCKISKRFHHRCRCERIETSSWLIEENQIWVCDKFDTDRCSLPLSTRDTFDEWSTDPSVLALVKLQRLDKIVDARYFLSIGAW